VEDIIVHVHFLPMPKRAHCCCMSRNDIHYHFTHCKFLFQNIYISWGFVVWKLSCLQNGIKYYLLAGCQNEHNSVCRDHSANHKYVSAAMGWNFGQYCQQCCHHLRSTEIGECDIMCHI
jgi:hypothetical protein